MGFYIAHFIFGRSVDALRASRTKGSQYDCGQDTDNGDDNEKFDDGKTSFERCHRLIVASRCTNSKMLWGILKTDKQKGPPESKPFRAENFRQNYGQFAPSVGGVQPESSTFAPPLLSTQKAVPLVLKFAYALYFVAAPDALPSVVHTRVVPAGQLAGAVRLLMPEVASVPIALLTQLAVAATAVP